MTYTSAVNAGSREQLTPPTNAESCGSESSAVRRNTFQSLVDNRHGKVYLYYTRGYDCSFLLGRVYLYSANHRVYTLRAIHLLSDLPAYGVNDAAGILSFSRLWAVETDSQDGLKLSINLPAVTTQKSNGPHSVGTKEVTS